MQSSRRFWPFINISFIFLDCSFAFTERWQLLYATAAALFLYSSLQPLSLSAKWHQLTYFWYHKLLVSFSSFALSRRIMTSNIFSSLIATWSHVRIFVIILQLILLNNRCYVSYYTWMDEEGSNLLSERSIEKLGCDA